MLLADAKAWPTLCGPGFFLGCVLQPLELAGPSAGRRGYDARSHATKKAQFRAFFVCSELLSGGRQNRLCIAWQAWQMQLSFSGETVEAPVCSPPCFFWAVCAVRHSPW